MERGQIPDLPAHEHRDDESRARCTLRAQKAPSDGSNPESDGLAASSDMIAHPQGVPKPLSLDQAVDEMAYWWFVPPSASSNNVNFLKIKSELFALRHGGMFSEGVSTYALQKQAYVTGDKANYLRQQNRLLKMVTEAKDRYCHTSSPRAGETSK